jgi:hypothetical protein
MEIIPQDYQMLLQKFIIDNFSEIIKQNIVRNDSKNRVFNYIELLDTLDDKLCIAAKNSLKSIFDAINREFKNSPERRHGYHIKSHQERTILTIFGEITIKRTFYKHKKTGKSFCYLDRYLGLKKYDYFDPYIKSLVVDKVSKSSYSKTALEINELIEKRIKLDAPAKFISKQTVHNIVKTALLSIPELETLPDKDTIYVMADEKFIATQNNDNKDVMVKSIVIFDGRFIKNGRTSLLNKRTFSSVDASFLNDALDYLYYTYNPKEIKTIIVMGDGAYWIKNLRRHFKIESHIKVIYALDKFHFKQAIQHITKDPLLQTLLVNYVITNKKQDFVTCLEELIKDNSHRAHILEEKLKYITNNWNAIRVLYKLKLKCPMEAQISHNIADLFSSRPKAYSLKMLDKLLNIRMLFKNNYNLKRLYLHNFDKLETITYNKDHLNFNINDNYPRYSNIESKLPDYTYSIPFDQDYNISFNHNY